MKDKVCLVTGATSGIGAMTALELARQDATVVLVGRDLYRCEQSVDMIRQSFPLAKISFLQADLSSQAQIHQLAAKYKAKFENLDVLVNNAGGFFYNRQNSVDGIEMTFALNHLNYFLLTHLLMDRLESSLTARIINVSSNAHKGYEIKFDDLQSEQRYSGLKAYGMSKLANILFTYELSRKLKNTNIAVNAVHPGLVSTNIGNNSGWLIGKIWSYITRNSLTPAQGALTNIYLASAKEIEGISGKYFIEQEAVRSSDASYDMQNACKLWDISAKMVDL